MERRRKINLTSLHLVDEREQDFSFDYEAHHAECMTAGKLESVRSLDQVAQATQATRTRRVIFRFSMNFVSPFYFFRSGLFVAYLYSSLHVEGSRPWRTTYYNQRHPPLTH
jgi:hypothetical protein